MSVLKTILDLRVRQGTGLKQLTRNIDEVEVAGYAAISTNTGNIDVSNRYLINKNNSQRIRQSGYITKFKVYNAGVNAWASAFFQIWRFDGSAYDLVAQENITSQMTAGLGIKEVILNNPISAQVGDYVAIGGTAISGGSLTSVSGYATNSLRYTTSETPTGSNYLWDSKSALSVIIPIKSYMQAPLLTAIGDSIIAGHPAHYSYIENSLTSNIANSISYQLSIIDAKYVCQNMGIGSQTSTQISARFNSDIVAVKPKIALINGGVNDIAGGTISKETFLGNYTSMLNLCVANNIVPVICKIIPWTNGTNTQMQTRDDWNASLKTLVGTYSGSICIDFDADLGKNRVGGNAGNLWDLKTEYNADGVHPNLAGYTKMAEVINREIKKKYRFI